LPAKQELISPTPFPYFIFIIFQKKEKSNVQALFLQMTARHLLGSNRLRRCLGFGVSIIGPGG
jgi:hypothetical protein